MIVEQDIKHGTTGGYNNSCRCDECKRAKRESRTGTSARSHGTKWGYDKGCRCDLCRGAKAAYWKKLHPDAKSPTTDVERQTRKCIVCDVVKPLEEFTKNAREFLGRDYRCRICRSRLARKNKNKPEQRFSTYFYGAKTRKISFAISFKEFMLFWDKPCYYCGDAINGIGLDRKDPQFGYTVENIVSCCSQCNRAKTIQTTDAFISMCLKVAEKFKNHIVPPKQ